MLYNNFINKLPDYTKDNSIDYIYILRIIEVFQNEKKDYLLIKSLTKKIPFLNFNNNEENIYF